MTDQQAQSKAVQDIRSGCLWIVAAAVLFVMVRCLWNDSSTSGVPEKHGITKAEWMQKAVAVGGQNYRMTGVLIAPAQALYQAVGQPSSIQSAGGGDAYLYWDCEDGHIQMVTPDGFLRTQGMLAGKINVY